MGISFESLPEHIKKMINDGGFLALREKSRPRRTQLEKELHKNVYNELFRRRIWFVDSRMDRATTQRRGVPDFICCVRGKFLAIELKRPGAKPTREQEHEMSEIESSGGMTMVATCLEEVIDMIQAILRCK